MQKIAYAWVFYFLALFFHSAWGQPDALQVAGQVVWVKGSLKAIYPEQAARVLARGALVYEKDTLITGPDSAGEISFTDNTIVSLRPDTTFIIEQYKFDQAKPTSGRFIMDLIEGGFRTITGFVAKAQPQNYQVKTPVATIGVRGTTYQAICHRECAVGLEKGTGVTVSNSAGTVILTPEDPYAIISSETTIPVLSLEEPAILARPPDVTPPSAPPPIGVNITPGIGTTNCGILVN
jgi:hypothetical protein